MKKSLIIPVLFVCACTKTPEACMEVSNKNPKLGQPVEFKSCSSVSKNLAWDFGDGTTAPPGTTTSHAYRKGGMFTAVLKISSDNEKKEATAAETITVQSPVDDIIGNWALNRIEEYNESGEYIQKIDSTLHLVFNDSTVNDGLQTLPYSLDNTGKLTIISRGYQIGRLYDDRMEWDWADTVQHYRYINVFIAE